METLSSARVAILYSCASICTCLKWLNRSSLKAASSELQQVQDTTQAQGVAGEEGNNNETTTTTTTTTTTATTTEQTTTPLVPTARIASAPLDVNRPKAIRTGGVGRKSSVDDLYVPPKQKCFRKHSEELKHKNLSANLPSPPHCFTPNQTTRT